MKLKTKRKIYCLTMTLYGIFAIIMITIISAIIIGENHPFIYLNKGNPNGNLFMFLLFMSVAIVGILIICFVLLLYPIRLIIHKLLKYDSDLDSYWWGG